MNYSMLQTEISEGIATIRMNRPEVHNAFDDALIAALTAELCRLDQLSEARVIVLAANGKSFSAGADLNWISAWRSIPAKRISGTPWFSQTSCVRSMA